MSSDARDAYQQGIAAQRAGQTAQAISAFQKALGNDRRAYKAAFALGVLADRSGNEGQALRYYQIALQIQADYEDAVQGIVNIYFRRDAAGQALSFVEPIARKWERNLRLQAIYADVLVRAGRAEDAEVAARKALKRDERCVPAMISLIKASLTRGRNELAESIIDQAIAIDNKNAELQFLRGKMYQQQERLGDALTFYQKAVELSPDYAEARMALGIQYLSAGNYSQALAQFETVARLAPTLVAVHLNLGDAYRTTKEWAKAKAEFDKALRLKRDLPEAHFNLALMYMSAGDKFPGLSLMDALNRAVDEFNQYRNSMGSRLQRDDASEGYLSDLQRTIQREQKRIEREKAQAARAADAKSEAAPSGKK
jgi:tetratricopeptide (TPR) repeat protein